MPVRNRGSPRRRAEERPRPLGTNSDCTAPACHGPTPRDPRACSCHSSSVITSVAFRLPRRLISRWLLYFVFLCGGRRGCRRPRLPSLETVSILQFLELPSTYAPSNTPTLMEVKKYNKVSSTTCESQSASAVRTSTPARPWVAPRRPARGRATVGDTDSERPPPPRASSFFLVVDHSKI